MVNENVQMFAGGSRRRNPDVIYYRNRKGWITWGDTQAAKQLDMINGKGCSPLPKYGTIQHSEDLWGPILRHPDGPAEFPVEQILAYRWYRKDKLPDLRPIVTENRNSYRVGTQPTIRFPQLQGVKVTEYPCPEPCGREPFHDPLHLGGHLRVMHGYDRSEILKYGEAMNIDFSKVPGGQQIVNFEFDEVIEEVKKDAEEVSVLLTTVSAESPATEETLNEIIAPTVRAAFLTCDQCDYTTEGKERHNLALNSHKRIKHPEPVPA